MCRSYIFAVILVLLVHLIYAVDMVLRRMSRVEKSGFYWVLFFGVETRFLFKTELDAFWCFYEL